MIVQSGPKNEVEVKGFAGGWAECETMFFVFCGLQDPISLANRGAIHNKCYFKFVGVVARAAKLH